MGLRGNRGRKTEERGCGSSLGWSLCLEQSVAAPGRALVNCATFSEMAASSERVKLRFCRGPFPGKDDAGSHAAQGLSW